jgi:hypothetical protein
MMFTSRGRGAAGLVPGSFGVFPDVLGPGGDPGPPRRGGRLGFAGGRVSGILAGVDLADGNPPATGVGDEPVPPQQQDPPVLDGDAVGAGRDADRPVL